jgi:2-haloacid dehalogenase
MLATQNLGGITGRGTRRVQRWATFDCYGTLIDWNGGILGVLEQLFGVARAPELLARYHELEPEIEQDGSLPYKAVMTEALIRLAAEEGLTIPEGESDALVRSLPEWQPFPEVQDALGELRHREWNLVILSNSDRDLITESMKRIGVPFELAIVAGELGSYKPAPAHWKHFFEATTADTEHHVHVAASLFHDIAPARELGLKSVWINRLGEQPELKPDRELTDLRELPDTLDELVPA